jgi:hypothetical protein
MPRRSECIRNPVRRYEQYSSNASKRGYEFEISLEEFLKVTAQPCSYCGEFEDYSGLDRVDNTRGYYVGNVVPCCTFCNRMKGTYSLQEFMSHLETLYQYQATQRKGGS